MSVVPEFCAGGRRRRVAAPAAGGDGGLRRVGGDGAELEVKAGQTVFIEKGERFRPMFPDGGTEYVPVCLPAFRPDRCIREEEAGDTASERHPNIDGMERDCACACTQIARRVWLFVRKRRRTMHAHTRAQSRTRRHAWRGTRACACSPP